MKFLLYLRYGINYHLDFDFRGEVKVDLLSPPNVGFHYELSFFKSGSTAINTDEQGKVLNLLKF